MRKHPTGRNGKYILQNDSVSMDQLCEQFSVHMITVRRDIAQLQRKISIEKRYTAA